MRVGAKRFKILFDIACLSCKRRIVMTDSNSEKLVGREADIQFLKEMPEEKLIDFLFLHIRDIFAVDGLYFLSIEKRFGTEPSVEIDQEVWEGMAVIEARRLRKTMGISGEDIPSFMEALRYSCWSLDTEDKEIEIEEKRGVFRNTNCRVQNTRISKGLNLFPCKGVRLGWMRAFAEKLNPKIRVNCIVCPPDERPEGVWCEWEFLLEE